MCVQETRWRKFCKGVGRRLKTLCTMENPIREMVLGLLSQKWKDKVLEVKRVNDQLMTIKLKISENMMTPNKL